eukprot:scaffold878_cov271-Pinguiococcus_pyrenoidosus.AAC.71
MVRAKSKVQLVRAQESLPLVHGKRRLVSLGRNVERKLDAERLGKRAPRQHEDFEGRGDDVEGRVVLPVHSVVAQVVHDVPTPHVHHDVDHGPSVLLPKRIGRGNPLRRRRDPVALELPILGQFELPAQEEPCEESHVLPAADWKPSNRHRQAQRVAERVPLDPVPGRVVQVSDTQARSLVEQSLQVLWRLKTAVCTHVDDRHVPQRLVRIGDAALRKSEEVVESFDLRKESREQRGRRSTPSTEGPTDRPWPSCSGDAARKVQPLSKAPENRVKRKAKMDPAPSVGMQSLHLALTTPPDPRSSSGTCPPGEARASADTSSAPSRSTGPPGPLGWRSPRCCPEPFSTHRAWRARPPRRSCDTPSRTPTLVDGRPGWPAWPEYTARGTPHLAPPGRRSAWRAPESRQRRSAARWQPSEAERDRIPDRFPRHSSRRDTVEAATAKQPGSPLFWRRACLGCPTRAQRLSGTSALPKAEEGAAPRRRTFKPVCEKQQAPALEAIIWKNKIANGSALAG